MALVGMDATVFAPHPALRAIFSPLCGEKESIMFLTTQIPYNAEAPRFRAALLASLDTRMQPTVRSRSVRSAKLGAAGRRSP